MQKTIVDLFELDKMEPEKAIKMLNELGTTILESVLARVLPTLSDTDMAEYEKIVDEEQEPEVLFKFLSEKVPNLDDIIKEESEALRAELQEEFEKAGI